MADLVDLFTARELKAMKQLTADVHAKSRQGPVRVRKITAKELAEGFKPSMGLKGLRPKS